MVPRYEVNPAFQAPFYLPTSAHLLLLPAWLVNQVFQGDAGFDIRWTGLTYGSIAALAFWLVLPLVWRLPLWRRAALLILLAIVYVDPQYVAPMNSFYTDTASLAMLLLVAAFAARQVTGEGDPKRNAWGIALSAVLLVSSKIQHSLLFLPLLILFLWRPELLRPLGRHGRWGAMTALTAAGLGCIASAPIEYSAPASYNVVFLNLLPNSSDPLRTLRELGIPEQFVVFAHTDAYQAGSALINPELRRQLVPLLSHGKLAAYLLRNPGEAWRLLLLGLSEASLQRPDYGNFTKDTGLPPSTRSEAFAFWSGAKLWMFERRPVLLLGFCILLGVGVPLLAWRARPRAMPTVLAVSAMLGIELGLSSLGDVKDTTRHLFLFLVLLDLLAVCAVALLLAPRTVSTPLPTRSRAGRARR
ncbi:MAG: hypothetical protein IPM24_15385 [Bryobacterales bacterium]|nr:hypothetical protein [Bryobacterales bacterium]